MESPGVLARHPALRWLLPLGIVSVAALAVLTASGVFTGSPSAQTLPDTAPATLVSAVQDNRDVAFSGMVVSHLSLGLPDLPALPSLSPVDEETSFGSLLSGSHTMQVWYGGVDKQRVALLGASEETDLFRDGRDLWQWSSADGIARHTLLAARPDSVLSRQPAEALTPRALAEGALGALDADTELTMADDVIVAGRSAYELVVTPHAARSKIGSVRLALDGATKVPLAVEVYPKNSSEPAIDVAFTSIRFGAPAERNFRFVPPPNSTVSESVARGAAGDAAAPLPLMGGAGWSAVYRLPSVKRVTTRAQVATEFHTMAAVSGRWGNGRLLESDLLSVLVTNEGRVYAGAVQPRALYAAAAGK